MSKPFYITTPLYYVNAAPHIGHSYTEIAADCLARYHRLKGDDVFFLTGTDEHGEKIAQAAQAQGVSPKAFADQTSQIFRTLWSLLGISYDHFIRTTDPDHERIVQDVLVRLEPQLVKGKYAFWYCVPCETSFGLSEIDAATPRCLNCQRPVAQVEEEDYFLSLEAHRGWLRQHILAHETFILPVERRNEILSLLEHPLPDLCITRPRDRVSWGIPVPFSDSHVTYVWFDALLNYISALGWPDDPRVRRYWDEAGAVHLIGKDILRHHALYWPIILHVLGVDPPKMIFAHGWWKIGEQKMSKSLGNIVDPFVVVQRLLKDQPYAADVYRYFLLRDVPFGQDGNFSEEAITTRLEDDLANDLGNLVNRTLSMIERYYGGAIPPYGSGKREEDYRPLEEHSVKVYEAVDAAMAGLEFSKALDTIMQLAAEANRYIETKSPWKLSREDPQRLETVLHVLAEVIRIIAILLEPFMPSVAQGIWQQLGLGETPRRLRDALRWPWLTSSQRIGTRAVLFPKVPS